MTMPMYLYKCECGHKESFERDEPPKFCMECGKKVKVHEVPLEEVEPEEDEEDEDEVEDEEEEEPPPVKEKPRERHKKHRKRRKVLRFLKFIVGEDVTDVLSDKDIWKDLIKNRAKKIMDAAGMDEDEQEEIEGNIEKSIDRAWHRARKKFK